MSSVLETIEDSFNYLSGQREIANTHVGTIGQTSLFNTQCPTLYSTQTCNISPDGLDLSAQYIQG